MRRNLSRTAILRGGIAARILCSPGASTRTGYRVVNSSLSSQGVEDGFASWHKSRGLWVYRCHAIAASRALSTTISRKRKKSNQPITRSWGVCHSDTYVGYTHLLDRSCQAENPVNVGSLIRVRSCFAPRPHGMRRMSTECEGTSFNFFSA